MTEKGGWEMGVDVDYANHVNCEGWIWLWFWWLRWGGVREKSGDAWLGWDLEYWNCILYSVWGRLACIIRHGTHTTTLNLAPYTMC
jgi:hypothetical protein